MQKYIITLAIFFSLPLTAQELQLSWKKEFNVATELAKSENKPILIYFSKADCDTCLQFYTDFFKQETFQDLSSNFILLMLDGSNMDVNTDDLAIIRQRRWIHHFNSSFIFPAVLVIDKDRQPLGELLIKSDNSSIQDYWSFLKTLN
ncbi:MAG: thioredoxin family protein [Gelidibacter sp.]